jgi:hypothetical protein
VCDLLNAGAIISDNAMMEAMAIADSPPGKKQQTHIFTI